MLKRVCDICGEDCGVEHVYSLPVDHEFSTYSADLPSSNPKEFDLCPQCVKEIKQYVKKILNRRSQWRIMQSQLK